jgi:ParB family chromosome partitioning protein
MTTTIEHFPYALEWLDPKTVTIGTNIRDLPDLDPEFVESIRQQGILQPILATRHDGVVTVQAGQSRTRAALQVGLDRIPVVVFDGDLDTASRIITQLTENEHRANIKQSERVGAYHQLSLIGYTAEQIAQKTSTPRTKVDTILAVAASPAAVEAADSDLTLDELAIVAEFDDDPEAVESLLENRRRGYPFTQTVSRLRKDREEQELINEAKAEAVAEGLTVIDSPSYTDKSVLTGTRIRVNSQTVTEEEHATCPGHVVYFTAQYRTVEVAPDDPSVVTVAADDDEDEGEFEDYPVFDDDGEEEEEGYDGPRVPPVETVCTCNSPLVCELHTKPVRVQRLVAVRNFGCNDWQAQGHSDAWAGGPGSGTVKKSRDQMTDDEAEHASQVRRNIIESNKAWLACTDVRRAWLATEFWQRKSAPAGGEAFIASRISNSQGAVGWGVHELLGTDAAQVAVELQTASAKRATHIALCLLVASWEKATVKETWRYHTAEAGVVLAALKRWGYGVSEVEQRVIDGNIGATE